MEINEQLIAALDALEADLPRLVEENPDIGDFLIAFGDAVEAIGANATPEEHSLIDQRVDRMLISLGLHTPPRTATAVQK